MRWSKSNVLQKTKDRTKPSHLSLCTSLFLIPWENRSEFYTELRCWAPAHSPPHDLSGRFLLPLHAVSLFLSVWFGKFLLVNSFCAPLKCKSCSKPPASFSSALSFSGPGALRFTWNHQGSRGSSPRPCPRAGLTLICSMLWSYLLQERPVDFLNPSGKSLYPHIEDLQNPAFMVPGIKSYLYVLLISEYNTGIK